MLISAVSMMEVGPPGSPSKRRSQSTAVSFQSRAGVGSDCGKGSQPAGQLCNEKTNGCELLLTHRKTLLMISKLESPQIPGEGGVRSGPPQAGELLARGLRGIRCIGSVSSLQALTWNRRTCRLGDNTRHRGGPTRSSDEGLAMRLERRGRAGQVAHWPTQMGRSR